MLDELFTAIDNKDAARFAAFFVERGEFRFGNMPEQLGQEAISAFVSGFFESIDTLVHRVDESWEIPGGIICHGLVTYTRKDGSKLSTPFANIVHMKAGGISRYQVFADVSAL